MCWVGKISESFCKSTNTKAERCGLIAWFGRISAGESLPGKYLVYLLRAYLTAQADFPLQGPPTILYKIILAQFSDVSILFRVAPR
jgi:hypothetical protein